MIKRSDIIQAFEEVRDVFPFPGYMDNALNKYLLILSPIMKKYPPKSKILSIGSGPCDLEAILSKLDYEVTALDDLKDPWHLIGNNRERIKQFTKQMNIKLIVESDGVPSLEADYFDVVLLIDVIEHLHTSPRELLNRSISALKAGGLLLIETPNSAALANRLRVLFGKSNQTDANFLYWTVGDYRSHVREYTESELKQILHHHKLNTFESKISNLLGDTGAESTFNKLIVKVYKFISGLYPRFRSTILIGGVKPPNWRPTEASIKIFSKYYHNIERWNSDNMSEAALLDVILKEHRGG